MGASSQRLQNCGCRTLFLSTCDELPLPEHLNLSVCQRTAKSQCFHPKPLSETALEGTVRHGKTGFLTH